MGSEMCIRDRYTLVSVLLKKKSATVFTGSSRSIKDIKYILGVFLLFGGNFFFNWEDGKPQFVSGTVLLWLDAKSQRPRTWKK